MCSRHAEINSLLQQQVNSPTNNSQITAQSGKFSTIKINGTPIHLNILHTHMFAVVSHAHCIPQRYHILFLYHRFILFRFRFSHIYRDGTILLVTHWSTTTEKRMFLIDQGQNQAGA